jgi:hypothetical protein
MMSQTPSGETVTFNMNPSYQPDGRKAYLKAMRKWRFDPEFVPRVSITDSVVTTAWCLLIAVS